MRSFTKSCGVGVCSSGVLVIPMSGLAKESSAVGSGLKSPSTISYQQLSYVARSISHGFPALSLCLSMYTGLIFATSSEHQTQYP